MFHYQQIPDYHGMYSSLEGDTKLTARGKKYNFNIKLSQGLMKYLKINAACFYFHR